MKRDNPIPMVYDHSRIRTRLGVARMYWFYSSKSVRHVILYFLKGQPGKPFRRRLSEVKPLRTILSEAWASWRKWKEFPFVYFINYLWVNYPQFTEIENFIPLIGHEKYRDQRVTLQAKLLISSKVFMSKFLAANGFPQAVPILYGESGRLFRSDNQLMTGPSELAKILGSVKASRIFVKRDESYGGKTVSVFSATPAGFADSGDQVMDFSFLQELALSTNFICQEGLKQIDALNALNPGSINTIRIMTKFRRTRVDVISAAMRVGRINSFVDNVSSGGLSCHVDLDSWSTRGPAVLRHATPYRYYDRHPDTDAPFDGINLPFHQEACKLVKDIAVLFPGCEIIGCDVALTPDGPVIVEVNWNPGNELPEMSARAGFGAAYFG